MNEEVKRFFASINYLDNDFDDAKVEKVKLNKATESFEVILSIPKVKSKKSIENLFMCAEGGINGEKKCKITLDYEQITDQDVKSYLDEFLLELIELRPSFAPLKDYKLEAINDEYKVTIYSRVPLNEVEREFKKITKYPGNITKFLEIKGLRKESYLKQYQSQQKEIKKLRLIKLGRHHG